MEFLTQNVRKTCALLFQRLSYIQELSMPALLDGQNVVICSHTGSGKTTAVVMAIANRLALDYDWYRSMIHLYLCWKGRENSMLSGLPKDVLKMICRSVCPTSRRAKQLVANLQEVGKLVDFSISMFFGGAEVKNQLRQLKDKKRCVVVGTPGTLNDLVLRHCLNMEHFDFVFYDDLDRSKSTRLFCFVAIYYIVNNS